MNQATFTREEEAVGADRTPIKDHPGFWRRGRTVCFKYRDHRRKQRWASAPNLRAAKRLKAQLETDVHRGEYRPQARVSYTDYARGWVETYQGRTSKPIEESTRKNYRRRLEQESVPFFDGMLLAEIQPQDIKSFVRHVAERRRRGKRHETNLDPVSQNTVRLALAPVKALFATAFEEGIIRVNPAAGVRIVVPRAEDLVDEDEDGEVKALTDAELDALLKKIPRDWQLFFALLVHLGLRIGELIELRWRDVDLGSGTVRIRRKFYDGAVGPPKSKYGRRTLRLTAELCAALWALRKATRAGTGDLVFTSSRGNRIDPSNLMARVLKPAAAAAGLGDWVGEGRARRAESWVGFHTLRHTCATLLFTKAGWNPKQVQLWLGHHSPTFTIERYVHLLPDDLPAPPTLVAIPAQPDPPTETSTYGVEATSLEVAR